MGGRSAQDASSDSVGVSGVMVQAGTHLATYFNSESGRLRIALPFLRDGIALGQPCILIATGEVLDRYIEALEKEVKNELDEARRRDLFVTAPSAGRSVDEALTFWEQRISAAMSATGPTIVRIVADMACVKTSFPSVQHMLVFERQVGSIFKQSPTVAVCQYDVREFDGPELLEAIKAHPDVSDLGFVKFVS